MARILIANRGEIARRVAFSAKMLGHSCVGMYEVDGERYPHEWESYCDTIIPVGRTSGPVFLDQEFLIRFAKEHGCAAVHPGYGYLSENAGFAKKCVDAGLIWIGPHAESIQKMASKAEAKKIAKIAGVPTIPGFEVKDESADEILDGMESIGFPVLIKASFGGGGKGMRIVPDRDAAAKALREARSEAKAAFGDDALIIEKYFRNPRHIEVQVLCDQSGYVEALGDRECSVQRRYQKLIEEAPAPFLEASLRESMSQAACSLAQYVQYDSVGTVEYIYEEGQFYFLEMNTRIQVEHTVTETVYGCDLVGLQIEAAFGASLKDQKFTPRGTAVQARICAEDPRLNFAPCPGKVDYFKPFYAPEVRWDLSFETEGEISSLYDPMIAKCIVWQPTRDRALDLLALALTNTVILGVKHNTWYLAAIVRGDLYRQPENLSTQFIAQFDAQLKEQLPPKLELLMRQLKENFFRAPASHLAQVDYAFQVKQDQNDGVPAAEKMPIQEVMRRGSTVVYSAHWAGERIFLARGEDLSFCVKGFSDQISLPQEPDETGAEDGLLPKKSEHLSPVPGKLVQVFIKAGSTMDPGDVLFVVESMKMQFEVAASKKIEIQKILKKPGDQLKAGEKVFE